MDDIDRAAKKLLEQLTPNRANAAPGQSILPSETRCDVDDVPLWRAHQGPATLFVHGWNDTHRVWRRFAQDFIIHSRPVLLMDLPGHGASTEAECSAPVAGEAVKLVCNAEQPIDTIIAHSFGCVATATALKSGATADYVVLIAPPILSWAETMRRRGVKPEIIARATAIAGHAPSRRMEAFDFVTALTGYEGKLLLIGSSADLGSPAEEIESLSGQLPGARFLGLSNVDHRDLCLDTDVLNGIAEFLGYS